MTNPSWEGNENARMEGPLEEAWAVVKTFVVPWKVGVVGDVGPPPGWDSC